MLDAKFKDLKMQPISLEELELIKNPLARPAWFAKNNQPQGGRLDVRQRVFGDHRQLLRGANIKDVRFVNCTFDMFQGYNNNLEDVTFEECQFFGGVFTGDSWKKVRFLRCEAEGPFKIGCADGDVTFEHCNLRGLSAKEGGYGNWSDHFGLATATQGSTRFLHCTLQNMGSSGSEALQFIDCSINELSAGIENAHGVLTIEGCQSKGKMDFGGSKGFSHISIRNSQLNKVDLLGVTSKLVEISDSSLSLEIGSPWNGEIRLTNSTFHSEGFSCYQSDYGSLLIDNCIFDKNGKGLQLSGQPNKRPRPGRDPIYWTSTRHLTLRNLSVTKAKMAYMQVGTLTLENATLDGADLSHCCFDTIQFKNARLTGDIDLTDTTFRHIESTGLANSAKLAGNLEGNPGAPVPNLSALDHPPGEPTESSEKRRVNKQKP